MLIVAETSPSYDLPLLPEENPPITKLCPTCDPPIPKPLSAFNKDHQKPDDYSTYCRDCHKAKYRNVSEEEKAQRKAHRKELEDKRRDKIKDADKARKNTDKCRARRRERNKLKREQIEAQKKPEQLTMLSLLVEKKICLRCEPPTEKPISEFSLARGRKDGHSVYCKECVRKYHGKEEVKQRRTERDQEKLQDEAYRAEKSAKHAEWRGKNKEYIRQYHREKYANDPVTRERTLAASRKWIKDHPMEMREHQLRRKARILETMVDEVDYTHILERDGFWCYVCEQEIKPHQKLEFDHVIPLLPRKGEPQGTHTEDNIKPTHKECNARKTNKRLEDLTPFDKRGVE